MTAAIPTHAPETFRKGTTVKWTLAHSDYSPDDSWALTYYFANAADAKNVLATDNGDGSFLVTISATISATFTEATYPGTPNYTYVGLVTKAGETFEIDRGQVEVLPSLSSAVDARSQVKKDLDAVEAMIANKLSAGDAASYSIAGRSLTRYSPAELRELRYDLLREYRKELQAERIEKGLGTKGKVRTRFISSS